MLNWCKGIRLDKDLHTDFETAAEMLLKYDQKKSLN